MLQHAASPCARADDRTRTVDRIEQLCATLRAERAWTALVQAERLLAEVHGMCDVLGRRAPPARVVAPDDVTDRLVTLIEAITGAWTDARAPVPSSTRLRTLRAALARTTVLLESTGSYDAE